MNTLYNLLKAFCMAFGLMMGAAAVASFLVLFIVVIRESWQSGLAMMFLGIFAACYIFMNKKN